MPSPRRTLSTPVPALLILLALLAGCAGRQAPSAPPAPPPPAAPPAAPAPAPAHRAATSVPLYTAEQFLTTTRIHGASFSPDGRKVLVASDESGIFNAYAVPVGGGPAVQLTHSAADAIDVVGYFPADERFLYLADQGGNELDHLYVQEPAGKVTDLTPGEKLKATFSEWEVDGRSFFFVTNERDERYFDLYEMTVDGYRRSLVYENDAGWDLGPISPDRRHLAVSKSKSTADSDVYLLDLASGQATGEPRDLTEHQGEVRNEPQTWSADGKSLLYLSSAGSEFLHLVRFDLASGKAETVLAPTWDVDSVERSRDGRSLLVTINRDAANQLVLLAADSLQPVALPGLPEGDLSGAEISPDGRHLAFYAASGRAPGDLWVAGLAGGDGDAPRRLTRSLSTAIVPAALVEAERVRFRSYDGVEVPGLLYRPHQASAEHKVPALVWVHGGPGGQSRVGYSSFLQFLANHGYAVFAINNRGSSGYGQTFYRMDDRRHGEADLGDCVASKGMLADTGWIDPERIGILGGSYGGYMVLAALTLQPREFAVGVDLYGISNWVRTLESIPSWWESQRLALFQELGDPATDGERLHRISPLFHAQEIVRPLLVFQGANDPRVLPRESDEIVAAARANGTPVEYVVFPDEGHGFAKRENVETMMKTTLAFLDRYLAAAAPQPAG